MNKKLVVAIVALAIIAGGFFLTKTIDNTPVVHSGCVVTKTTTHYKAPKNGGNKHYIKTENCGKLLTNKKTMKSVEEGKTYDLTATGTFSWFKTVTEAQER